MALTKVTVKEKRARLYLKYKIARKLRDADHLIPNRIPYNGGMQKDLRKAKELLEQVIMSIVNDRWISKREVNNAKRGE